MESEKDTRREKENKRQNEKTDLVPCGGGVERCTGHYVEHWHRKSELCGPYPADRTLPWPSLSSPGFIPSCPWDSWSARSTIPHSLTVQSSEFNSICVSGENFSFWSVCIFPAVDSVTHWGLTRKKRLYRGCDTWTILSGNVGGAIMPASTAGGNFLWHSFTVQCAARYSRYILAGAANVNVMLLPKLIQTWYTWKGHWGTTALFHKHAEFIRSVNVNVLHSSLSSSAHDGQKQSRWPAEAAVWFHRLRLHFCVQGQTSHSSQTHRNIHYWFPLTYNDTSGSTVGTFTHRPDT